MNTDIKPRSAEATRRQAIQVRIVAHFDEHVVLFGGPENLVRLAHALACAVYPQAERLICHPDDYAAAGLRRNGPETFLEILPLWDWARMRKQGQERRKAALRPVEGCPRGEVWVDLSDPGRRKRAGL